MVVCLLYTSANTGSAFYRLEMPHTRMIEVSPNISVVSTDNVDLLTPQELSIIDLFVVSRSFASNIDEMKTRLALMKSFGAGVILDIDDYWHLGTGHSFYKHYLDNNLSELVAAHIRHSDAVIATTTYLAKECLKLNKNVEILPNIPYPHLFEQFHHKTVDKPLFSIGYFGAAQHEEDVEILRISMGKLAHDQSLDGRYNLYLAGWNDNPVYKAYENIFSSNLYNINYKRIAAADIYSYIGGYNFVDVSLAPLRKTKFNSYKSELKVSEAAIMGKAIIASDIPMYADCIEDGVHGFLIPEHKHSLWYKRIRQLINEPGIAQELASNLKARMAEYLNAEQNENKRINMYKSFSRKK